MELSVFLAKYLGLYFLLIGSLWIFRKQQFDAFVDEVISSRLFIQYSGVLSLLVGLAIIIEHSIWDINWRVVITLIGYLAVLKGIMRLGFPEHVQTFAKKVLSKYSVYIIALMIILGAFLTYHGFFAHP